jgi:hypothetical protein
MLDFSKMTLIELDETLAIPLRVNCSQLDNDDDVEFPVTPQVAMLVERGLTDAERRNLAFALFAEVEALHSAFLEN